MLERLIAFICEELGCDESQINGETVLNELVSDDIEIQEKIYGRIAVLCHGGIRFRMREL